MVMMQPTVAPNGRKRASGVIETGGASSGGGCIYPFNSMLGKEKLIIQKWIEKSRLSVEQLLIEHAIIYVRICL